MESTREILEKFGFDQGPRPDHAGGHLPALALHDLYKRSVIPFVGKKVEPLRGRASLENAKPPEHVPPAVPRQLVQIGRTFGNGQWHAGIDPILVEVVQPDGTVLIEPPERAKWGYTFAPVGERTAEDMILKAISEARRFIYIEDQYLVSTKVRDALVDALPRINHLTILIPDDIITIMKPPVAPGNSPYAGVLMNWKNVGAETLDKKAVVNQARHRRHQFLEKVLGADKHDKVRVFILKQPGAVHSYVHSKMFIFDDEVAIIGSANCNRRSYTHDSEVIAAIADQRSPAVYGFGFAHRLRIALWAEHLGMQTPQGFAELADGVASVGHWRRIVEGCMDSNLPEARIAPYDLSAEFPEGTDYFWDLIDPYGGTEGEEPPVPSGKNEKKSWWWGNG